MKNAHKYPEDMIDSNILDGINEENSIIFGEEIIKDDSVNSTPEDSSSCKDTGIILPDITENDVAYHSTQFTCPPSAYYKYTDKLGVTAFYIVRWDFIRNNERKKETRPYSFNVQNKEWRSNNRYPTPHPLYNLLELVSRPDAPVLIVEGEKTVEATKRLFPDYVVVTSCGGANATKKTDWSTLEGRDIIIAPDNDKAGEDYAQAVIKRCKKSAYIKSIRLLKPKILGKYVIEDSRLVERKGDIPKGYDLADSLAEGWTAELINKAMDEFKPFFTPYATTIIIKDENVYEGEEVLEFKNHKFKLGNKVLYLEQFIPQANLNEDGSIDMLSNNQTLQQIWTPICGYLKATHYIRDVDSGNWGILLKLIDIDGKTKDIVIQKRELVTDKTAIELLLDNGLEVFQLKKIHAKLLTCDLLNEYINSSNPQARAIGVNKVGWHGNCYLLPFIDDSRNSYLVPETEQAKISKREEFILQSNSANPRKLIRQGTIEGWQNSIGKLASGNNLLMFSIATALAASLFSIFGEEGCCFHFSGSSSIGKTTTLYVASSVWGMGKPSSFRTTDNAAESLCKNSNDGLLLMDELAEIDPNSLEKITYLFGNGTGKARATRSADAQTITTFRILGLSTGEVGLQAKLMEKGKSTTAGQSVRFIEIPADSGQGLGIFDTLHHFESGRDLSDYLRKECHDCGVVIDKWMQNVTLDFEAFKKAILATSKSWLYQYLPSNSGAQVERVAKKFALIASIGEIAINVQILPFEDGAVSKACKVLFDRWLEQRGNNGSHEFQGIIERLKMLTQEGINSRFLNADGSDENKIIQKLAGYKKCAEKMIKNPQTGKEEYKEVIIEFWIFPEVFTREILENRNNKIFCKQLIENGYLLPDKQGNKSSKMERVVKQNPRRFYVVPADKISD
jgi:putative DNA primase/helicase